MLALWQLMRQVDALALYAAMKAARLGQIPWTPELAREHNRDWLQRHAPHVLASCPNAMEDGICPCGGLCLVGHVSEAGLYHHCTTCGATYQADWTLYLARHASEQAASGRQ